MLFYSLGSSDQTLYSTIPSWETGNGFNAKNNKPTLLFHSGVKNYRFLRHLLHIGEHHKLITERRKSADVEFSFKLRHCEQKEKDFSINTSPLREGHASCEWQANSFLKSTCRVQVSLLLGQ